MPQLTPITNSTWIVQHTRKGRYYGPKARLRLCYLPHTDILPEHFMNHKVFDVEYMLICLRFGAWLNGADWRPYVRFTIARRLKERKDRLFRGQFAPFASEIMQYQLQGGTFALRDKLRKLSRRAISSPDSTPYDETAARLVASITDPIEENTLIQPFHWIRATLVTTEALRMFGLNLYNSENELQKRTLCEMLKGKVTE